MEHKNGLNVVIFTKDRPAQLNLLLESMKLCDFGKNYNILIIQKTTTRNTWFGYTMIRYPANVNRIEEGSGGIKDILINNAAWEKPYTMFIVDDNVFIREVDTFPLCYYLSVNPSVLAYSLRLSPSYNYCYAYNSVHKKINGRVWPWKGAPGDFGYPMSLDCNIYRTEQILERIKGCEFRTPNELEGALAGNPISLDYMVCNKNAAVIGIPWTRVQGSSQNRYCGCDWEEFSQKWMEGQRICLDSIIDQVKKDNPISCHHVAKLVWRDRVGNNLAS